MAFDNRYQTYMTIIRMQKEKILYVLTSCQKGFDGLMVREWSSLWMPRLHFLMTCNQWFYMWCHHRRKFHREAILAPLFAVSDNQCQSILGSILQFWYVLIGIDWGSPVYYQTLIENTFPWVMHVWQMRKDWEISVALGISLSDESKMQQLWEFYVLTC